MTRSPYVHWIARLLRWFVSAVIIQAVLLGILSWILPDFQIEGIAALVALALFISVSQSLLWPFLSAFAARFGPWLYSIIALLLTGVAVSIASYLDDQLGIGRVEIDHFGTGVLIALGLSVGNTLLAALFAISDDRVYDRFVTEPWRRRFDDTPRSTIPGFLFLEIDGLSEPILRQALDRGDMPTLKRWLDSGNHKLMRWDPDLSCQTSASQAGILLGSNEGIPAFRWWDKPRQALMVSSSLHSARLLEDQLSTGNGLLAHGGFGRWNAFSGNAQENIGVASVFADAEKGSANTLLGYVLSPYMLARVLTLYIVDVLREGWEGWMQQLRNVQPRVHRGLKYAFVRAATTTAMQEASRSILTADMLRGAPVVYNTFFGYDEVAHHSGIDREDSFKILATLDKVFAHLERVAREAPRPYHLVILSDHGQSQGATFRQRYGKTLADLTGELIASDGKADVMAMLEHDEALDHVNVALSEAVRGGTRSAKMLRGALQRRMDGEAVNLEAPKIAEAKKGDPATSDAIVLASGNLGIISFPRWQERMSLEQIGGAFPRLIPGLVNHPGISLLLLHSEAHGPLAMGKGGIHYLEDGTVEGDDPLAPFGPEARGHLLREAHFVNVPDILVISQYDPVTKEVAAFEELVGNHGGLGGPQREPFVLYPADLDPGPGMIVGAGHLHDVLRGWVDAAGHPSPNGHAAGNDKQNQGLSEVASSMNQS
ncbi:MAG: phage holin family protein [Thermomicrobiales bacterium]